MRSFPEYKRSFIWKYKILGDRILPVEDRKVSKVYFHFIIVYFQRDDRSFKIQGSYTLTGHIISAMIVNCTCDPVYPPLTLSKSFAFAIASIIFRKYSGVKSFAYYMFIALLSWTGTSGRSEMDETVDGNNEHIPAVFLF